MITIEKYADLCALMADTAGDANKENAMAQAQGVTPAEWAESKAGFTAKMSDPKDMGKTAMVAGIKQGPGEGGGWTWILSDLKSLLESGLPMSPQQGR